MDVVDPQPLVPPGSPATAVIPWRGGLVPVPPTPVNRRPWSWTRFVFFLLFLIYRCRRALVAWRQQAHYYRAMHQRACRREQTVRAELRHVQAQLRELEQRFYGRKAETAAVKTPTVASQPRRPATRRRGQQPGRPGPARRNHDHLPAVSETCELPPDRRCCPQCRQPLEPIAGADTGTILEVEVRAHRRVYRRQRYRPTCTCAGQPGVVTAPPPPQLIPKSNLGVSIWVSVLVQKFAFFQPLYRVLGQLRNAGLDLPVGTITDGLQKLLPLFAPLYDAIVERNRQADHWHADETRWLVFVPRDDKAGFAWTLWVFAAKDTVVYVLDPTRAHDVPEQHLDGATGILNVDRYSAYKAMEQVKAGTIVLAFCWAHVRRDFLAVLTGWPELTDWACTWIYDIALLYQRNNQRLDQERNTPAFAEAERQLREHVAHLEQRRDQELAQAALRQPQRKVLTSLQNHWPGLTLFVEQPHVPLDNNEAERRVRGPVVARKNFYGSGALWSGRLAALLFTLFQTLGHWDVNVQAWLMAYLNACAAKGGQPPPTATQYLPWNLSAEQREAFRQRGSKAVPRTSEATAATRS
jgi:transposase